MPILENVFVMLTSQGAIVKVSAKFFNEFRQKDEITITMYSTLVQNCSPWHGKCGIGEGHCDSSDECLPVLPGLTCGTGNCLIFIYMSHTVVDCLNDQSDEMNCTEGVVTSPLYPNDYPNNNYQPGLESH